jgi:hypothetical protein
MAAIGGIGIVEALGAHAPGRSLVATASDNDKRVFVLWLKF